MTFTIEAFAEIDVESGGASSNYASLRFFVVCPLSVADDRLIPFAIGKSAVAIAPI